jgi:hypothetical protein
MLCAVLRAYHLPAVSASCLFNTPRLTQIAAKGTFLLSACVPCANNNKHVICKIVYFQSKICTAHWQNKSTGVWIILIFFLFKELRAQREKEEEALVIISKCYAKKNT